MTRSDMVFIAEGSVRYHRCRAEHFASRNRWISIASVFLGTGVVAGTIAESPAMSMALGIIIAFANAYRLVAKPDQAARDHEKWCKDWASLLGEAQSNLNPNDKLLTKWNSRVSELNGQCMEDMKAVKAHCFNEAMTTLGRLGTPYKLSAFQRWTKNTLSHTHGFDRQNQAAVGRVTSSDFGSAVAVDDRS